MKIRIQSSSKGIALIIVMLVILILATLAGAFAYSMKIETTLARNANNSSEFEWLGRSGVELAKFVLSQKCPGQENVEALNQKWAGGFSDCTNDSSDISLENISLGAGLIRKVTITDLERKFNINVADQTMLRKAMTVMGVDASLTSSVGDAILDWVDKDDDAHLSGAESDFYSSLDPPYFAKNGPMDDISELLLIKGIIENPEIYYGSVSTNYSAPSRGSSIFNNRPPPSYPFGLTNLFTTLSTGKINVNTAPKETLDIIDENFASEIIKLRSGPDGADGTDDDLPLRNIGEAINVPGVSRDAISQLSAYCDVRSFTFEVQVEVELNGVTRNYTAIIRRGNRPTDFGILKFYWK